MQTHRPSALRAVFCHNALGREHEILLMYRENQWDLPGGRRSNEPSDPYENFLCGVHEDCGSNLGTLGPGATISATRTSHPAFEGVWGNMKKLYNVPKELLNAEESSARKPLMSQGHTIGYLLVQDWPLVWRPKPTTKRREQGVQGFAWATLSATSIESNLTLTLLGPDKTEVSGYICQEAKNVLQCATLKAMLTMLNLIMDRVLVRDDFKPRFKYILYNKLQSSSWLAMLRRSRSYESPLTAMAQDTDDAGVPNAVVETLRKMKITREEGLDVDIAYDAMGILHAAMRDNNINEQWMPIAKVIEALFLHADDPELNDVEIKDEQLDALPCDDIFYHFLCMEMAFTAKNEWESVIKHGLMFVFCCEESKLIYENIWPEHSEWMDRAMYLLEIAIIDRIKSKEQGGQKLPATKENRKTQAERWEEVKKRDNVKLPSVDKLMSMAGLEEVKQMFLQLYEQRLLDKERNINLENKSNYNARFDGNPGTGKSTVSRLYGQFLIELGVLPKTAEFTETTGSDLAAGGDEKFEDTMKEIKKKGGGVYFIDEAYQLAKNKFQGANILQRLVQICTQMEGQYGNLVVIVAGYQKDMDMFFDQNEGLPRRFPHKFHFKDFKFDELLFLFNDLLASVKDNDGNAKPFRLEDERLGRIVARRLAIQSGTRGFGNAGEVKNRFDAIRRRQSERISVLRANGEKPDLMLFTREDVMGKTLTRVTLEQCHAWQELKELIGLKQVKKNVLELMDTVMENAEKEWNEEPLQEMTLNKLFVGNPGTGKTTVAELYAQILGHFGILSKGHFRYTRASDFVGITPSDSIRKTQRLLKDTNGGVLIIDEAYVLYEGNGMENNRNMNKKAVIDTLVEMVHNKPGDDRAVLLLGYQEEMETLLLKCGNAGFARRFPSPNQFVFEDFTDRELVTMLRKSVRKKEKKIEYTTANDAVKYMSERERPKPNFGNAGSLNNMLNEAFNRMNARCRKMTDEEKKSKNYNYLLPEDFPYGMVGPLPTIDDILSDIVGMDDVKTKFKQFKRNVDFERSDGNPATAAFPNGLNFLFTGPPGTGKTTVARKLGLLFQSLGFPIDGNEPPIEVSASNFTTGYMGQSGQKTREIFTRALGRVLIVDEAPGLIPKHGSYNSEVINEIVQLLTNPKFKNKLIVVFTGYELPMQQLMKSDEGLNRRFPYKIKFEPIGKDLACSIFRAKLLKRNFTLNDDAERALGDVMQKLIRAPGWSNAGDVELLFGEAKMQFGDDAKGKQKAKIITKDQLQRALKVLLKRKCEVEDETDNLSSPFRFDSNHTQGRRDVEIVEDADDDVTEDEEKSDVDDDETKIGNEDGNKGLAGIIDNVIDMEDEIFNLEKALEKQGVSEAEAVELNAQLRLRKKRLQERKKELKDMLQKRKEQTAPIAQQKPAEGKRAHFSGALIHGTLQDSRCGLTKLWFEDEYSEYVGLGEYKELYSVFSKSIYHTFDSVAIDKGTKIVFYSQPNFKGNIVFEKSGPCIIWNGQWARHYLYGQYYESCAPASFTKEATTTDMRQWHHGSMRITQDI